MDLDRVQRKKFRYCFTLLRESIIFSIPLPIISQNNEMTIINIDETKLREIDRSRKVTFHLKNDSDENILNLNFGLNSDDGYYIGQIKEIKKKNDFYEGFLIISDLTISSRRGEERYLEKHNYFNPVLLTFEDNSMVMAYSKIIDSSKSAISLEIQVLTEVPREKFENIEITFTEKLLDRYSDKYKPIVCRNYNVSCKAGVTFTRIEVVIKKEFKDSYSYTKSSIIQSDSVFFNFTTVLHDKIEVQAKIEDLYAEGVVISLEDKILKILPNELQIICNTTNIRFRALKRNQKLFLAYESITLESKTRWYNFLTSKVLNYDHCFNSNNTKEIIRLMLESGNYNSSSILQLELLSDYFKMKWPIENIFSSIKYRWLVRSKSGSYIGHTSAIRISDRLWGAIDNIGSQSFEGKWNHQYVYNFLNCLKELLSNSSTKSLIQWTFIPSDGIWSKFDELIKNDKALYETRERFWGYFLINRERNFLKLGSTYSLDYIGENLSNITSKFKLLSENDAKLLEIISDGFDEESVFQQEFLKEYGFKLKRYFYIINSCYEKYLLTFTNYPSWATLHKGHNWDYIFPLTNSKNISNEKEFLDAIEVGILKKSCIPYRLAIVSKYLKLDTGGCEWINLSLNVEGLKYAALSIKEQR